MRRNDNFWQNAEYSIIRLFRWIASVRNRFKRSWSLSLSFSHDLFFSSYHTRIFDVFSLTRNYNVFRGAQCWRSTASFFDRLARMKFPEMTSASPDGHFRRHHTWLSHTLKVSGSSRRGGSKSRPKERAKSGGNTRLTIINSCVRDD